MLLCMLCSWLLTCPRSEARQAAACEQGGSWICHDHNNSMSARLRLCGWRWELTVSYGKEASHPHSVKKTILHVNTWFNQEITKVANLATYCLSPEARSTALGWALFFLLLFVPVLRDIYGTIFEKSRKTGIIPFYGTINNYGATFRGEVDNSQWYLDHNNLPYF